MSTDAIREQDASNTELNGDDVTEALLRRWSDEDADKPSEPRSEEKEEPAPEAVEESEDASDESPEEDKEEDDQEEEVEASEEEDEEAEEDEGEKAEEKPKKVLKDDAIVKVSVDGKELDVPVEKLKRLYGQEASLTRKSQEVAAKRKEVEETGATYVAALSSLLERARHKAQPFAQVDFAIAAKELDNESYSALKSEAQRTFEEVRFLEQELGAFMQAVERQKVQELQVQARETVKVLEKEIPNWSDELYNNMRAFAINQGLDEYTVNTLVDPTAWKMINMAYQYHKGQNAVTKPKVKKPKKIVKSTATNVSGQVFTKSKSQQAQAKVMRTGSVDDVTEALLARWANEE